MSASTPRWERAGTLSVRRPTAWSAGGARRVVGLDLDSTLIETRSGRRFAASAEDWRWKYDNVPDVLRALAEDGYGLLVVTNQLHATWGTPKGDAVRRRVDLVLAAAGVDAVALVATDDDEHRKPRTGTWSWFVREVNGGVVPSARESAFVGDAAGRAGDHSDCDRKFALNLGVLFQTPEELFRGQPPQPYALSGYLPARASSCGAPLVIGGYELPDVLVLVGRPASGKSTLCERVLVPLGYVRVCQDDLGTRARCLTRAGQLLDEGISVVVDATSGTPAARAEWVALARGRGVRARALLLLTPPEQARHMNLYRDAQTRGARRRVPDVAYRAFDKGYVEPSVQEGFDEVLRHAPVLSFASPDDEALYRRWYA